MNKILRAQSEVSNDLLEKFRGIPTSMISDNLDRVPGAVGLRAFHRGVPLLGRALTVRTREGDNLAIHRALDQVCAGDVLVIDGGGFEQRALIGEIIVAIARKRGAVGLVVDGAIRDVDAIQAADFPCYARAVIHRGPYKDGPGEIGVPITVGGMLVNPGDIVVGDGDGVLAFGCDRAEALLRDIAAQEAREAAILASVADGTYSGAYGKPVQSI